MRTMKIARQVAACGVVAMIAGASLFAQESASRPFGLDPYKPSDAKLLRDLGPALVTRMPVSDLSKLDPYNPTDAALLRQMGGAIPICCLDLLWPIGPIGARSFFVPGAALTPRTDLAPPSDPNVVWVCKGSGCSREDVRTHEFVAPPAQPEPAAATGSAPPAQQQ